MHKKLTFAERARFAKNPLARELLTLLHEKKTHLSLSCDVLTCQEVLDFADLLGPEICVLKTHVDILTDFSQDFIKKLQALAVKHRFFIFEDRKFADIGHTVKHQYAEGIYHIADWAHMVNAHVLPGPGIISGLSEVGLPKNRGLLLLASMSSKDNLLDAAYSEKTLKMAEQFPEFVMGFIAQKRLSDNPQWIYMTPGVQLESGQDALGQQYVTPEKAIRENGSDIIIVGRGILKAEDPLAEAKKYRKASERI